MYNLRKGKSRSKPPCMLRFSKGENKESSSAEWMTLRLLVKKRSAFFGALLSAVFAMHAWHDFFVHAGKERGGRE